MQVLVDIANSLLNSLLASTKLPPNRITDLPLAVSAITTFNQVQGPGKWKNLERFEIAGSLERLINGPDRIQQSDFGLCVPAVFFNIWIQEDPLAFTRFAIDLYDKGTGKIGYITVSPGPDLLSQDYEQARVLEIPSIDWMVMSALRDSENTFLDFEGTTSEDEAVWGSNRELVRWLKATTLFSPILNESSVWSPTPFEHALALQPTISSKIILRINTNMLNPEQDCKHVIGLRSSIKHNVDDTVTFTYWSWGKVAVAERIPVERFKATYFGSITACRSF